MIQSTALYTMWGRRAVHAWRRCRAAHWLAYVPEHTHVPPASRQSWSTRRLWVSCPRSTRLSVSSGSSCGIVGGGVLLLAEHSGQTLQKKRMPADLCRNPLLIVSKDCQVERRQILQHVLLLSLEALCQCRKGRKPLLNN